MKAELIEQGDYIRIDEFVCYADEVRRGNPYNTRFLVFIKSGLFSGFGDCEYDIKDFKEFVLQLEEMYNFKRSTAVFKDICYGSEIVFTIYRLGEIRIEGTVYAYGMDHSLTFSFRSDQSALLPFINGLKSLINNVNI